MNCSTPLLTYRVHMTDASGNVLADPCVCRVAAALASFGVRAQITVLDDPARTARQAADALGIEIAQITNSLVFRAYRDDDTVRPLLVLRSPPGRHPAGRRPAGASDDLPRRRRLRA